MKWQLAIRRRRRRALCAAASLTMAAALVPEAAAQASVNFGMGAAVPIGSSADLLNPGYSAMLSFAIQPSWMRNYLRFEGAVNSLTEKSVASAKSEFLSATANLVLVGAAREAPSGYVIIGAGSYQQSVGGARRTDAGFNVGAGIHFPIGFVGTFVEARLHYVADSRAKYFPMTFGLTF